MNYWSRFLAPFVGFLIGIGVTLVIAGVWLANQEPTTIVCDGVVHDGQLYAENCQNYDTQVPQKLIDMPPRCEEDMPCWDCGTMGNRVCGPVAEGTYQPRGRMGGVLGG